jgi:C-terminal processing protease CtpA/Prc
LVKLHRCCGRGSGHQHRRAARRGIAGEANLKAGDRIQVDGRATIHMSTMEFLKYGLEAAGSKVRLAIQRAGM